MRLHPPRRIVLATAIAVVPLGLFAAACASTNANPSAASTQSGTSAYLDCLARNGVTLPSALADRTPGARGSGFPSGRPSGGPRPSGSSRPSGGFGGGGFGGGGIFGTQAPAGVDQNTWNNAQQACASLRPTARPSGTGNPGNSAQRAYRNCLNDHGVSPTAGVLNTADPTVAAAMQACAPLRPTGGPGGAGSPSS
jgi:hypothetical protein